MNLEKMKKDELVDLAVRRFLFNDYLPPLSSEEYNELIEKVSKENIKDDLIKIIEPTVGFTIEVVEKEFRKYPNSIIRKPLSGSSDSAGLDIYLPVAPTIKPNGHIVIQSDIRYILPEGKTCLALVRSSTGIKMHVTLSNSVGLIDRDFAYSEGGGSIGIALHNTSDRVKSIPCVSLEDEKQGRVAQLVVVDYYIPEHFKNDVGRVGGIGSTDEKGDE